MIESKVLAPDYYLANFKRLLNFVVQRYDDILSEEELMFHHVFHELNSNAQQLYVRLISRKGPYFRVSKLNYPEIHDIMAAIESLLEAEFLFLNPREGLEFAMDVWLIDELRLIGHEIGVDASELKGNKPHLVQSLLEFDGTELWSQFEILDQLIVPAHFQSMNTYMLLFFGNNYQTLSDFILEDIGVLRYENYEIHDDSRCFKSRAELEQLILLNQLRQNYWYGVEVGDIGWLKQVKSLLDDQDLSELHVKRADKLYNDLGAYFEKHRYFEEAVKCYGQSNSHPCNERIIRILDKQQKHSEALDACETLCSQSNNYDELVFANFFKETQKRKLGLDYIKQKRLNLTAETIQLSREEGVPIEIQVVKYYTSKGISCFYTENRLWKALFGLVFWDLIFLPLKGAFYNPFQREPNDFRSNDFRLNRAHDIEKRLEEVEEGAYTEIILDRYQKKQMTANSMVSWKQISYEQIELALQHISPQILRAILDRMAFHPGEYSSGFPDIFSYNKHTGFEMIEVKGPGDQLRNNQRAWMKYFREKEIPFKVVAVSWN